MYGKLPKLWLQVTCIKTNFQYYKILLFIEEALNIRDNICVCVCWGGGGFGYC